MNCTYYETKKNKINMKMFFNKLLSTGYNIYYLSLESNGNYFKICEPFL